MSVETLDHFALCPGTVNLGVDIVDGKVQIGKDRFDDDNQTDKLAVVIGSEEIRVSRADGEPLQIDAYDWHTPEGHSLDYVTENQIEFDWDALVPTRKTMLAQPVAELVIKRDRENGQWFKVENEDTVVADRYGMELLLTYIESHAPQRQFDQRVGELLLSLNAQTGTLETAALVSWAEGDIEAALDFARDRARVFFGLPETLSDFWKANRQHGLVRYDTVTAPCDLLAEMAAVALEHDNIFLMNTMGIVQGTEGKTHLELIAEKLQAVPAQ